MKKLLLLCLTVSLQVVMMAQQKTPPGSAISRENLIIRPNSRDYNIVNKGNNHQRVIQMRSRAMIRNKQALMNRQMAMERRRALMKQQMFRQQNLHQRLVSRRFRHR